MAHRRYQIRISDDGNLSAPVEVGNEPNCLGWELSWSIIQTPGMALGTQILCRDDWEGGGPGVNFGPFTTKIGGKLFCPFPALRIQAQDFVGANIGNFSTIRIVARPVLANGWSGASSIVESMQTVTIAAAATGVVNLPPQVWDYKVTTSQQGPLRVSLLDSAGAELSFWEIANPSDTPFDSGGQNWREGTNGAQVSVVNGGGGPALVTVWSREDFRRLR